MHGLQVVGRLSLVLGVLVTGCTDGSNTSASLRTDDGLDGGASAALRDAAALDAGQHDVAAFAQGCAALLQTGALGLQAAIKAADRSCLRSSDCIRVLEVSLRCDPGCEEIFVSDAGLGALQTALDHTNESVCTDYQARGCPERRAVPCLDPYLLEVQCTNGRCQ